MINVYDNFLDSDSFSMIKKELESDNIPWFYNHKVTNSANENLKNYQLTHTVFIDQKITSQYYELFLPLLHKIKPLALIKIKLNLNLYAGESIFEHGFHSDYTGPRNEIVTTGVYYINTNNGYTIFEEDNEKIYSRENRFVEFPTTYSHSGSTSTNIKNRMVLNLNYIK